jgi:uncharacterized protein (DUF1697 family)
MLVNKAYKFRIHPNKKQIELINKTIGCSRFVFNFFLAKQRGKDIYWYRLSVHVILRTSQEWEQIIKECPYKTEGLQEGESVQVAFLTGIPSPEGIDRLSAYQSEMDEYQIIEKNLYLFFRHSIRDSKLAANLSKLGVSATVRNWKTVIKLDALSQEIK